MSLFEVRCHCGNIVLKAEKYPTTITSCNCSICYKLGALWGYYVEEQVEIVLLIKQETYSWKDKKIMFHRCSQCGCTTHYTSTRDDGSHRIAINTRMAPSSMTAAIPIRHFDGANTWQYLNE